MTMYIDCNTNPRTAFEKTNNRYVSLKRSIARQFDNEYSGAEMGCRVLCEMEKWSEILVCFTFPHLEPILN
jgi:hypothetical protein